MKLLTYLFLIFALTVSCGTGDKGKDKKKIRKVDSGKFGDAVIEGSIGEPSNLIPILSTDSASHNAASYVYNGLLKYDKNLNLVGDLADSWNVSNDKKSISFILRKGVKWHDGKDFTAKDVKFTYELITDNKTPTAYDSDFRLIDSIKVNNDHDITIIYKTPYAPALSSWTVSILPEHLLKGSEITKSQLQRKPIGTGPYKFVEWKSGSYVTLEAFDDYFEGRANISRYTMKIIPDSSTMFMELLNGNVDLMGLSPLQFSKQTDNPRFKDKYAKYTYLSNSYTYVGFNLKNKLFQDKRVRQALTYATPKDDIVKGALFGLGQPTEGPFKPGSPWYYDNITKKNFDLEKSKALLKEAGWKDNNNDGVLDKDNVPLQFTIIINQGNQTRSSVAEILQQSWKKIGVKVNIKVLEWATFINEYIDKRNFEAVLLAWTVPLEPDLYDVWHSSKCSGKNLNFICYQNKDLDQLIEKGRLEFDTEKRKQIYYKAQQILADDQPYIFLFVPKSTIALSSRFKGIEESPAGISHNFINWYVPKNEQKYKFKE